MRKFSGMTLAEILIAVSIVGILTAATIVGSIQVIERAKHQRVRNDIISLNDTMHLASLNSGRTLTDIVHEVSGRNDGCLECLCWGIQPLSSVVDTTNACWVSYVDFLEVVYEEAHKELTHVPLDPWGAPYLLDPKEGVVMQASSCRAEGNQLSPNRCYTGSIQSAGRDGVISGGAGTNDDNIWTYILPALCKPITYCWFDEEQNWEWTQYSS